MIAPRDAAVKAMVLAALTTVVAGRPVAASPPTKTVTASTPTSSAYGLTAQCTYAEAVVAISWSGDAHAYSSDTAHQPSLTYVKCEVMNEQQSAYSNLGMDGASASTSGSRTGWSATLPTTVCVTAFALFGPVSPIVVNLPRTCA